jgi:hypothetical protein
VNGFYETPPPSWQEIAEALSVQQGELRRDLEEATVLLADVNGDPTPLAELCGRLRIERDAALAAVARVRQLHGRPRTERHGSGCVGCGVVWPCPTLRALDAVEAIAEGGAS